MSAGDGGHAVEALLRAHTAALRELEEHPDRLLCIVGPTASGKTELAIRIAESVSGEIVSADSVQIYRGFNLGSGKPTESERARAPHRLIDSHDPFDAIDAAAWAALAESEIHAIRARGKTPIVCGGTYFWVRALVMGLAPAPGADPDLRERHRQMVETHGPAALHDSLRAVDPRSADRLHPNDVLRVSRALEVHALSGRTLSSFHEDHGFRARRFDASMIALRHEPDELTRRIAVRVERWLSEGFIDEVRKLLADGFRTARAMGSVGYAEVRAYLDGALPEVELRDAIVRSTRVFARRQRTWLNRAEVTWF